MPYINEWRQSYDHRVGNGASELGTASSGSRALHTPAHRNREQSLAQVVSSLIPWIVTFLIGIIKMIAVLALIGMGEAMIFLRNPHSGW